MQTGFFVIPLRFLTDAVTVNCLWFGTVYVILTGISLALMFLACSPSQKLGELGREQSQLPKRSKETCMLHYACPSVISLLDQSSVHATDGRSRWHCARCVQSADPQQELGEISAPLASGVLQKPIKGDSSSV